MAKLIDPIQLEIYRHLFTSIPEEMGTALKRTAYSPNIKERRDYSCAIFDVDGQLAAMGDHMPVHLGSMPLSVQAAISAHALGPGDIVFLNDPFCGGTHLPDITMIAPVYEPSDGFSKPVFYTATRAHHSDIGGMSPGSMPLSEEIFQEGLRIPPLKLYRAGQLNRDLLSLLLWNVRTPREREGDLAAQVGALRVGEKRLLELLESNGRQKVEQHCAALQNYSEKVMKDVISRIPNGRYKGEDLLDDEGGSRTGSERAIRIRVSLTVSGSRMKIDFRGSDAQVKGCMNAVYPVTLSAVYYVLRCLAPDDAPASAGLMRPVGVTAEPGTIVNAQYPAATAGGNVETSQRIVDTLLKALSSALPKLVPAASSGTMNNLALGGIDPLSGSSFSYYETIGGGMGASPERDGDSGVHTHMTNSLNTPIEVLEYDFPVRVREYRLRNGSGGKGKFRGGDGIIRSLEVLTDCQVTILSDRRKHPPYGLNGGGTGKRGANYLISKGKRKPVPGKVSINLSKGDTIQIESPGGGGWGTNR